jgi:(1->4)-alpha-D-glucan 1-alpha-D-glucosylmutase
VEELSRTWWTGDLKLLYVVSGLRLREREPELLIRGSYHPLSVRGTNADHIIAFAREYEGKILLTIAGRWFASLLSSPQALHDLKNSLREAVIGFPSFKNVNLMQIRFTNLITGTAVPLQNVKGKAKMPVGEALGELPAAVLLGVQDRNG